MTSDDDFEAIRRCQEGDVTGLETLVRHYQLKAVRIAYLLVQDRSAAEDIVQDSFLMVYQKCAQFRAAAPFAPWFFRIVVNEARRHLRSVTRRRESSLDVLRSVESAVPLLLQAPDPSVHAEYSERRDAIFRVLSTLTPKQREVLVLRYYGGYSDREIAHILASPPGTVRWRLHTAHGTFERAMHRIAPWLEVQEKAGENSLVLMNPTGEA